MCNNNPNQKGYMPLPSKCHHLWIKSTNILTKRVAYFCKNCGVEKYVKPNLKKSRIVHEVYVKRQLGG